jgi:hypothetical protein
VANSIKEIFMKVRPQKRLLFPLALALTLMLNLGVATVYAQRYPVKMVFSGTAGPSAVNLQQPSTTNSDLDVAGNGLLGSFTFHAVRAITALSPSSSSTCSGPNKVAASSKAGAGVLRFQDGSLLKVTLTQGEDCVDLVAQQAHCILTFQITGGTGRFKDASGTLTLTETVVPLLADALNNPVFFTTTGEFTGTVSGAGREWDHQEDRQ